MAARRGALAFATRLGAGSRTAFAPLGSHASLPVWTSEEQNSAVPSTTGVISRGFASDAAQVVAVNESTGLNATAHTLKNPTHLVTYDECNHERYAPGDEAKRAFTYFVLTGGRFIYASAIRLAVLKFILTMAPGKDVLAMASLEVDPSNIEVGQSVTVKWRGKPVFIKHRSPSEIADAMAGDAADLRDKETDIQRAPDQEWLVVLGVCTHLGCVPIADAGDFGGWFCPCHGSHYDVSGRIRKGPAPYNLEVPEYKFNDEGKLVIG